MTEFSELMKKTLSFGLGVAALTGDKVKQFVDEAVQRGEMSREEAHKIMDEVSTRADEERKSMQAWIREQVNKMLVAGGAASVDQVAQLEARLEGLERRFATLIPAAPEEVEPLAPEETPPTV